MKLTNYTGVLLAGGNSSRMGEDKGLLKINGVTNIGRILDLFNSKFERNLIITNSSKYNDFCVPVYPDLIPQKGPLAGIVTALHKSPTDYCFFSPCDAPFISSKLIDLLVENNTDFEAVVPVLNGRIYPLTAIYNKKAINKLNNSLDNNVLSVKIALKDLNVKEIELNDTFKNDFLNFNTKEDLILANLPMLLTIKYLGMLEEATNKSEETIEIQSGTAITEIKNIIFEKYPKIKEMSFQTALNQKITNPDTIIISDSELALLPPFAGG